MYANAKIKDENCNKFLQEDRKDAKKIQIIKLRRNYSKFFFDFADSNNNNNRNLEINIT